MSPDKQMEGMKNSMLSIVLSCAILVAACSSDVPESKHASDVGQLPASLRAALIPLADSTFLEENPMLERILHPVGRLQIPDEAAGSIRSVDVYSDGSALLVDYRRDVFIIDSGGGFKRKLSFDKCDPGYSWDLIRAQFFPDGRILVVSNTRPAAMIFDGTGECIQTLDLGTMLPIDAIPISNDHVAVMFGTPDAILTSMVSLSGESTILGSYSEQIDFLFRARPSSSLVAIDESTVMWIVYTRHGTYTSEPSRGEPLFVDLGHSEYKLYDKPDFNSGSRSIQDAIFSITSSNTFLSRIFRLDSNRIVVFFQHGFESFSESDRSMSLDVIDENGIRLNSSPVYYRGYRSGFVGAYGGHVIRIGHEGDASNLEFYTVSNW